MIELATLNNHMTNGWADVKSTFTMTYVSTSNNGLASQRYNVTLTGDWTSLLSLGIKCKVTHSGSTKYFYVAADSITYNAGTNLTSFALIAGQDFVLDANPITNIFFSSLSHPLGFPHWFTHPVTWSGTTTNPVINNGTINARFCVIEGTLFERVSVIFGSTSTPGSGNYGWSIPFTVPNSFTGTAHISRSGTARMTGSIEGFGGNASFTVGGVAGADNSNAFHGTPDLGGTVPYTWTTNDRFEISFFAELI